ncbi:restriction endonuclease subunit S [Serratia marcescens]|uniref:restriction endonuclease subunit S n=1 Tax=Serratia marcescens TaxID=615 RepID=UPI00298E8863|nr:restriction endonuclease subunit S [Serratia marcescens]MDW7736659.1 restriction endonuclease subunit S [Serratia marcescens]
MSGEKLPEGWVGSSLGEVLDVNSGVGFPIKFQGKNSGDYPVYKVSDISLAVTKNNGNLSAAGHYISKEEAVELKGKIFRIGSTAFAKIGEAVKLNRRAIVQSPGLADNNVMVISAVLHEMDKFIFHFMNTIDLSEQARSTTVPSIRKGDIENIRLALPSIYEQKIIAEKLDTLLAQVDNTKARLEQIPQILKRFRQVVLAAIVNGKLSTDTEQWKVYSLKNLCVSISDGDHQAPPKSETGIPFLVISDVNKGRIDLENVSRWVPESYYRALKEIRKPSLNDILYTVTGSFGVPVVVNTTKPFCFQRHIAILKPNSNLINYRFLSYYLEAPQIFKHASDVATGTAQKTVSLSSLRNFELSVPSLKEQAVIVHRVEQLFAYADTIEKQVNNALTCVKNLTQSILAKAFRGELTAEWRAENPGLISGENSAAALLKKIKGEREAIKILPKPKRSTIKKKTGERMSKQIIKVVEALTQAGEPLSGQQLLAAAGYPSDSSTDDLEKFFLDVRQSLIVEKSIVKLERKNDGQDWFSLAEMGSNE